LSGMGSARRVGLTVPRWGPAHVPELDLQDADLRADHPADSTAGGVRNQVLA
jgi:hypothetical protein